jgi:ribosomal peptide maturation radical SAM protein 1
VISKIKLSDTPKVLFASMPWTTCYAPSLGLGILKSQLDEILVDAKIKHFNLFLLRYLSINTYTALANLFSINDFVFTYLFEPELSDKQINNLKKATEEIIQREGNFKEDERYNTPEKLFNLILKLRNQVIPQFLSDCLNDVKEYNPTMVGFTCMFDQTIASLALAKLIKAYNPNIFIVLGGYAVEGTIGEQLIKSFSFIDCVVFGKGEYLIEDLAKASVERKFLTNIANICYRKQDNIIYSNETTDKIDINKSPCPNYDDFLLDIDNLSTNNQVDIIWRLIPIITSQGCWWGEKNHCIFCGINEKTIQYSYKKPEIVLSEIIELSEKYNLSTFLLCDYILPYSYYNTLLPELAKINATRTTPFTFSCEIKANVKEEYFYNFRKAGIKEVQPGVESFSTNVLKKINKGVTAIQNIYCLILGIKYGININYNILFGFPNDEIMDYDEMLKTIPMLYHLHPPATFSQVAITKDSPLQLQGEKYGLIQPCNYHHRYNILFSEFFISHHYFDFKNYCYYFENTHEKQGNISMLYTYLSYQIDYWQKSHKDKEKKRQLYYKITNERIVFFDSRYDDTPKQIIFNLFIADVYKACECVITSSKKIISQFKNIYSKEEIEQALNVLSDNRLIYQENNQILGLAFHETIYEQKEIKQ